MGSAAGVLGFLDALNRGVVERGKRQQILDDEDRKRKQAKEDAVAKRKIELEDAERRRKEAAQDLLIAKGGDPQSMPEMPYMSDKLSLGPEHQIDERPESDFMQMPEGFEFLSPPTDLRGPQPNLEDAMSFNPSFAAAPDSEEAFPFIRDEGSVGPLDKTLPFLQSEISGKVRAAEQAKKDAEEKEAANVMAKFLAENAIIPNIPGADPGYTEVGTNNKEKLALAVETSKIEADRATKLYENQIAAAKRDQDTHDNNMIDHENALKKLVREEEERIADAPNKKEKEERERNLLRLKLEHEQVQLDIAKQKLANNKATPQEKARVEEALKQHVKLSNKLLKDFGINTDDFKIGPSSLAIMGAVNTILTLRAANQKSFTPAQFEEVAPLIAYGGITTEAEPPWYSFSGEDEILLDAAIEAVKSQFVLNPEQKQDVELLLRRPREPVNLPAEKSSSNVVTPPSEPVNGALKAAPSPADSSNFKPPSEPANEAQQTAPSSNDVLGMFEPVAPRPDSMTIKDPDILRQKIAEEIDYIMQLKDLSQNIVTQPREIDDAIWNRMAYLTDLLFKQEVVPLEVAVGWLEETPSGKAVSQDMRDR